MQNPLHPSVPRRGSIVRRLCLALFLLELVSRSATAQWLHYPSPGIPRLPDGRPNLSAPTPRSPDGRPDLYGIWEREGAHQVAIASVKPEDVILTPEGEALQGQRKGSYWCLPEPLPQRTCGASIQNPYSQTNGGDSLRGPDHVSPNLH